MHYEGIYVLGFSIIFISIFGIIDIKPPYDHIVEIIKWQLFLFILLIFLYLRESTGLLK